MKVPQKKKKRKKCKKKCNYVQTTLVWPVVKATHCDAAVRKMQRDVEAANQKTKQAVAMAMHNLAT